jgi:Flp pilus assembly protein TadD
MASRKGQTEFALACVRRAVALAPANAEFLGDLGDQLARAGDRLPLSTPIAVR